MIVKTGCGTDDAIYSTSLISLALEYLNVEREKKIPLPPANTIYISASIPLMVLFNGSFA